MIHEQPDEPKTLTGKEAAHTQWREIKSRVATEDLHIDARSMADGRALLTVNSTDPKPEVAVRVHIPAGMTRGEAAERLLTLSLTLGRHDNWTEFFTTTNQ